MRPRVFYWLVLVARQSLVRVLLGARGGIIVMAKLRVPDWRGERRGEERGERREV